MRTHQAVQVEGVLEYLPSRLDGTYADCTLGGGGHAEKLLELLPEARVFGIDRDAEALEMARRNLERFSGRVSFVHGRFSELAALLAKAGIDRVDGLLADLGASYGQLTSGERGFSFQSDGPLDMRQDASSTVETASEILNFSSERNIADILYTLGEERRARRVARSIVRGRPIRSTHHLVSVIGEAVPRQWAHAVVQRTFMALRMAVNQELEELEALLQTAPGCVRPGGRIVIISFHSLEDRPTKRAFQELARLGRARLLTRKVVQPSEEEVARNLASRSSKLRAVEMI